MVSKPKGEDILLIPGLVLWEEVGICGGVIGLLLIAVIELRDWRARRRRS